MNILVVDNDKNIVEMIKTILATKGGYKIDIACNGKEALDRMKINDPYNLAILAVLIPKLDGMKVCEVMVRDEKLKKIPVLLTSILPLDSPPFQEFLKKIDGLSIVKDTLEKPFSADELLVKVRAVLGEQ